MPSLHYQIIMDALRNPKVRSILSVAMSSATLDSIDNWLGNLRKQYYLDVLDIANLSSGLSLKDKNIALENNWGVKLINSSHPFIFKPSNIRYAAEKFFVTNSADVDQNGSCTVLDENLNLVTQIGKSGVAFGSGQYTAADDFIYLFNMKKYIVASKADHILQVYNESGVYEATLGTPATAGTSDVAVTLFDKPVAIAVGERGLYVCNAGSGIGATGRIDLFTATTNGLGEFNYVATPLYAGKSSGSGKLLEGEVTSPKDIFVTGSPDKLFVLNGNDEIGIFDVNAGFSLERVINIPSDIYSPSLGLSRLAVHNNTIYVTAANTGEVLAIDSRTGTFLGKFGELRNEATLNAPQTLGFFNGLAGVAISDNTGRVITTETNNNRIQTFGTSLLSAERFSVTFSPVKLPNTSLLKRITIPAGVDSLASEVAVVDVSNNREYTVQTAIDRQLKYFAIKLYFSPSVFSMHRSTLELYPISILCEETT